MGDARGKRKLLVHIDVMNNPLRQFSPVCSTGITLFAPFCYLFHERTFRIDYQFDVLVPRDVCTEMSQSPILWGYR